MRPAWSSAVFALSALVLAAPVLAGDRYLSGEEIAQRLTNRTAIGEDFRQFFGIDGTTLYAARGEMERGAWWIEGELYCSSWDDVRSCYRLYEEDGGVVWVSRDGLVRYPARLVEGLAIDATAP